MPLYRLVTWPSNRPHLSVSRDVEAESETHMGDLAVTLAGFGEQFDFWRLPDALPAPELPAPTPTIVERPVIGAVPDDPVAEAAPPRKKGARRTKPSS